MDTRTRARRLGTATRTQGSGSGRARTGIVLRPCAPSFPCLAILLVASLLTCGCTSLPEYIHNGLKVGPNYVRPAAPVAQDWIDAADKRVRKESDDLSTWWTVFHDPVLDSLVCFAYQQNLTLRQAGFRVLEARAQLAITTGSLFPQMQFARGDYTRYMLSRETANTALKFGLPGIKRSYSQWDAGFNLNWELDFWGRFRRAIESDAASLDASVESYDDVLVTLLGDVATYYAQVRTLEQRIKYAQDNVQLQRQTLDITEARWRAGTVSELDVDQARSTMEQTEAAIPELEISLRQANNQLCILLGVPPEDLKARLDRPPSPRRRRMWPSASPPTCCAAGRTSAARSVRRPPSAPKSAWPSPTSIRTSRSPARSAIRPRSLKTFPLRVPRRQRRSFVPMEHPQLWAHLE